MGKAELHDLTCSARVALMLVSKFCNMLIRSLMRIDASQHKIWHLGFKSAEEVLVPSVEISDIWRCVLDGCHGAFHTRPREKPVHPNCWYSLMVKERPSSRLFQPALGH